MIVIIVIERSDEQTDYVWRKVIEEVMATMMAVQLPWYLADGLPAMQYEEFDWSLDSGFRKASFCYCLCITVIVLVLDNYNTFASFFYFDWILVLISIEFQILDDNLTHFPNKSVTF